uniref:Uncharacterized protein n=1 Tax=Anguilla anguilla TaxID=7936 RepID=A0A0E9SMV5_ANGAN
MPRELKLMNWIITSGCNSVFQCRKQNLLLQDAQMGA